MTTILEFDKVEHLIRDIGAAVGSELYDQKRRWDLAGLPDCLVSWRCRQSCG